jgi:hypothetical protein
MVRAFSTGRFALGDPGDGSAFEERGSTSNSYLESNTRPENDFRPMHIFPRTHAALRIDQLRYSSYRHGSGVGHQPSFAQGLEHE